MVFRSGMHFPEHCKPVAKPATTPCRQTSSPQLAGFSLPKFFRDVPRKPGIHVHCLSASFPLKKREKKQKACSKTWGKTAGSPSSAHCRAEKSSLHKNPLLLCPLSRVGTKVRTSETFRTLRSLRILCLLFSRLHRRTRSSVPGFLPRWEHSPALSHHQADDVQRCLEADGA